MIFLQNHKTAAKSLTRSARFSNCEPKPRGVRVHTVAGGKIKLDGSVRAM
jgi:NAD(P)-dependent dehydrogenase (short-subunit alcohol dehydrogenase family)